MACPVLMRSSLLRPLQRKAEYEFNVCRSGCGDAKDAKHETGVVLAFDEPYQRAQRGQRQCNGGAKGQKSVAASMGNDAQSPSHSSAQPSLTCPLHFGHTLVTVAPCPCFADRTNVD